MQRFRGGLVFKAHRLLYHSTLGLRVIKKKTVDGRSPCQKAGPAATRGSRGCNPYPVMCLQSTKERERERHTEIASERERERAREREIESERERERERHTEIASERERESERVTG